MRHVRQLHRLALSLTCFAVLATTLAAQGQAKIKTRSRIVDAKTDVSQPVSKKARRPDASDKGAPRDRDVQRSPQGACCLPNGDCVVVTPGECLARGGTYQGDGSKRESNAIVDGSFEAGVFSGNWAESSTNFGTPLCDGSCGFGGGTGPNSGSFWAWFGGIPAFEEGAVSQAVTIPVGATTLDFFLEMPVSSGNGVDFLEVNIDGKQEYLVLENFGPFAGYILQQVDIAAYADGGVHTVEFHSIVTGAAGRVSNFFVGDVAIHPVSSACPQPYGACRLEDGSCVEGTEEDCDAVGGLYGGDNTPCAYFVGPGPCPTALSGRAQRRSLPPGACCLSDGSCVEVTERVCEALGGAYKGDGTPCASVNCPQPVDCFVLDFETDDIGAAMPHGAMVDVEYDCNGSVFPIAITGSVNTSGQNTVAIFDSTNGPSGTDPDLLIGKGNVLILQNDSNLSQCPPSSGVYCSHNDDGEGGTITFTFCVPARPSSIVLIDQDLTNVVGSSVVLTDGNGKTRTYAVPRNWTGDPIEDFPELGWKVLDLTTLADQPGFAGPATASEQAGFDLNLVVTLKVTFSGSGGIDDLSWCQPSP